MFSLLVPVKIYQAEIQLDGNQGEIASPQCVLQCSLPFAKTAPLHLVGAGDG